MGYQIGHLINGPSGNTYATIEAAEAALDQLVNATWEEEAHALREILDSYADGYDRPAATENHSQHRFAQMVEAGEDMEAAARACVRSFHQVIEVGSCISMDDETAQYLLRNPELRFYKNKNEDEAAGYFLLAISNALLEGREIPMQSRIALGQALREAALLSLNTHSKADKKAAGKSLLKSLALEKGGGMDHFERSAMTGQTNQKLAHTYNIGKNEV